MGLRTGSDGTHSATVAEEVLASADVRLAEAVKPLEEGLMGASGSFCLTKLAGNGLFDEPVRLFQSFLFHASVFWGGGAGAGQGRGDV